MRSAERMRKRGAALGLALAVVMLVLACRDPVQPILGQPPPSASSAASAKRDPDLPCARGRALPQVARPALSVLTLLEFKANVYLPLVSGDALKRGDRFAFFVRAQAPGFVYVIERAADGSWSALSGSETAVPAEQYVRIPGGATSAAVTTVEAPGPWLTGVAQEGDANGAEPAALDFMVVHAPHALSAAELDALARTRAHAAETQESALAEALLRHQRAYALILRARGIQLSWEDGLALHALTSELDDGGLGVVHVAFERNADDTRDVAAELAAGAIAFQDFILRDGQGRHGMSTADVPGGAAVSPHRLAERLAHAFEPCTALLLYDYRDGQLASYLVDGAGVQAVAHTEVAPALLERSVLALRAALVGSADGTRALRLGHDLGLATLGDPVVAAAEAQRLILPEPIARALAAVRHLVVVPAYGIASLPFAALTPFGPGDYLVDHMSVTIAPSVRDLWLEPPPWHWPPADGLVIGNPAFAVPDFPLDALPGAEREARFVAQAIGAEALLGAAATREAFFARISHADFVFVATHAEADAKDPVHGSHILLAGDRSAWITPYDVMERHARERLDAKLVVLSACQTALGGFHAAGVVGLARAFQLSGAPRVVMSQWRVADEPTEKLMRRFTGELAKHMPAEALRRAMVAMRAEYPNPAYWAPFTLFGIPR